MARIHLLPRSFYVAGAIALRLLDILAVDRGSGWITMIALFGVVGGVSLWGRTRGLDLQEAFFLGAVLSTAWLFPLLFSFG